MISPDKIDYGLVGVVEKKSKKDDGRVKRWELTYSEGNGERKKLLLYIDYNTIDPMGYVYSPGLKDPTEEKFGKRRTLPLFFDTGKDEQIKLLFCIDKLTEITAAAIGIKELKPVFKSYDSDDGSKRFSLWTRLIESKEGIIYTPAYDADAKSLDLTEYKTPIAVRPAISLSVNYSTQGYHMNATVSEVCVIRRLQRSNWSKLSPNALAK